ncbi:hypothetical protein GF378_01455 [Candidatus Pacearchaeota archaeon]|nr:hypothetical protein [Candidatus Pacearchaeota archaeon]
MDFAFAGYLWYKKESKLLWIPIAYFGVMELLQFLTYFYLDACTPTNQILTFLSYLHISFQPFFINALMLYFVPKNFRKKIIGWVFFIAFIATILMLVRIYPFDWAGSCTIGTVLCGERLCSIPGSIHLAWEMPINGIGGIIAWTYTLSVFLIPLSYGAWKATAYNVLAGPVIARALTSNPNEWPAVWCLLSVAYIFLIIIPGFKKLLTQKKWYFWKYPK